jgi:hypothetical protein
LANFESGRCLIIDITEKSRCLIIDVTIKKLQKESLPHNYK